MSKIIAMSGLMAAFGAVLVSAGEPSITPAELQLNASGIRAMDMAVPAVPVKAAYYAPGEFGHSEPGHPGYPGHDNGYPGHHGGHNGYPGHSGYPGYNNGHYGPPGHHEHHGHHGNTDDSDADTDADTDADANPGADEDDDEDEDAPVEQPYIRCQQISTMEVLARIAGSNDEAYKISKLARLICSFPNDPAGTIKYPDGKIAYVGSEYADAGSWKYPDGYHAYVAAYYSDSGSWKYPDGHLAYFGPSYKEKESWTYPNGGLAYVGPYYQDRGSWKYPSGYYAYVGSWYSDTGSWKYPGGKYAYNGVWRYPNGAQCAPGTPTVGVDTLLGLAEASANSEFPHSPALHTAIEGAQTISKLQWIERIMPVTGRTVLEKDASLRYGSAAGPVSAPNICPESSGGCCSSDPESAVCDVRSTSMVK